MILVFWFPMKALNNKYIIILIKHCNLLWGAGKPVQISKASRRGFDLVRDSWANNFSKKTIISSDVVTMASTKTQTFCHFYSQFEVRRHKWVIKVKTIHVLTIDCFFLTIFDWKLYLSAKRFLIYMIYRGFSAA